MSQKPSLPTYQILVQGILDERWLRSYDGLQITRLPGGETEILGEMDQSALHGLLNRIGDLGIELILVRRASHQPAGE